MQPPQPHPHPQKHQQNNHQQEKTPVSKSVIIGAVLVVVLAIVCGVGALGAISALITPPPSPPRVYRIGDRSEIVTKTSGFQDSNFLCGPSKCSSLFHRLSGPNSQHMNPLSRP